MCDNCLEAANGPGIPDAGGLVQHDVDADGYGNRCDGDFDNDGLVAGSDITQLLSCLSGGSSPECAAVDADGDGLIGGTDQTAFLQQLTRGVPGPSGLACAGTSGCGAP